MRGNCENGHWSSDCVSFVCVNICRGILWLELLMRSGEVDAAHLKPLQDEAAELRNIMSASAITARKNLKQEKHNFTNGQ